MSSNKLVTILGALVFLALACASLYRLLVGFPITIAGMEIGQTVSLPCVRILRRSQHHAFPERKCERPPLIHGCDDAE